ncbi:MAG: hypothetical protein KKH44_06175 [Bacteroidetes bacterium]|nr:hypothetical protein [Bacteroidota bacterium]
MDKLNIVIVSGVIFPRISPRAFRATELAKALAKKGHAVTLIAALGKFDYSNFEKETGIKVKNLGNSKFEMLNSDGKVSINIWKKAVIFALMKLAHFPDSLLISKVKKAVLKEKNIDLLITVAIPYPVHWGVSFITKKQKNFKTWISDCGDPFMGNEVTKPIFYFKYIEKLWGKRTDFITVPVIAAKDGYYSEVHSKIHEIPQGFDFSEVVLSSYIKNEVPTFLYAGLFYPELRDPSKFLAYLCTLTVDFKFIIYTTKLDLVKPYLSVLKDKIEVRESVDRTTLMLEMSKVDFLINIENKGNTVQVPSKLIDYTLAQRPILNISSDFHNEEKNNFDSFIMGDYSSKIVITNFERYDSKNIAAEFIKLYQLQNV